MRKRLVDLVIVLLFGFVGLFFYFRIPKAALLLHQQISKSNPNNLDEERIKLSEDYETFLLSNMPKNPKTTPNLLYYLIGKQRKFLDLRVNQAIEEIKNTQVDERKIRVWSLLNMGVVVKTNNKIIAFDIADIPLSRAHKELANITDIIITSHADGDHYDKSLLKKALNQGKSLVFLDGFGFKLGKKNISNIFEIKSGETINIDGVKVTAYQTDHRGDGNFNEANAWFLVEVNDFKLLHTGDGRDFKNKKERELLNQREDIDIFLVNVMIHPLNIRDIKPKVIVPLHLYKFMHNREHLEQSTFNYAIDMYNQYEKDLRGIEKRLLFCGEGFEL